MYLVLITRMPGESHSRRLRSLLLCLCDVVVGRFYVALFSALEQTHCARM